jgi:hypothetical protein
MKESFLWWAGRATWRFEQVLTRTQSFAFSDSNTVYSSGQRWLAFVFIRSCLKITPLYERAHAVSCTGCSGISCISTTVHTRLHPPPSQAAFMGMWWIGSDCTQNCLARVLHHSSQQDLTEPHLICSRNRFGLHDRR